MYELRITMYELRGTIYEVRSTKYEESYEFRTKESAFLILLGILNSFTVLSPSFRTSYLIPRTSYIQLLWFPKNTAFSNSRSVPCQ